jgi:hypothetical protein
MKYNHLAFWSGLSAFFATILAIGAIDILNPSDQLRFLSSIVVGLITAGAVYSKQQLDDAKKKREHGQIEVGKINITNRGNKRVYSLELDGDPSTLENKQEVVFRVNVVDEAP